MKLSKNKFGSLLIFIISFIALSGVSEIALRFVYAERINYIDRVSYLDFGSCVVYPSGEKIEQGLLKRHDEKKNTYRIFVFGGSSVQGYPFEGKINIPGWMSLYLTDIYPERNVEVVNCGSTGADTISWSPLFFDAMKYAPDAMVIYAGHNNFVEPTLSPELPSMSSAARWFSRLYAARLFRGAIKNASRKRTPVEPGSNAEKASGVFVSHLEEMISAGAKKDIPVIVSTIQSNLSGWSAGLTDLTGYCQENGKGRQGAGICEAEDYIEKGECGQAVKLFNGYLDVFNKSWPYALVSYYDGVCLEEMGDYDEALKAYEEAVRYDFYRHRAPEILNERIKSMSGKHENLKIVDAGAALKESAKHGIPGSDMFVDHVHPTTKAQKIIAMALVKGVVEEGVIDGAPDWSRLRSDDEYEKIMGIPENETDIMELSFCFRLFEQRHYALSLDCYERLTPSRRRFTESAPLPILQLIAGREPDAEKSFKSLVNEYGAEEYADWEIAAAFKRLKELVGERGRAIRSEWPPEFTTLPAPDFKAYMSRSSGLSFR